jgi:hypothetical protein
MTLIHRNIDAITNEVVDLPYTKKELDEVKAIEANDLIKAETLLAAATAKAALLARLGITADEAKLLLK